jgi:hypothetical protein
MVVTRILADKVVEVLRRAPEGLAVESVLQAINCGAGDIRNKALGVLRTMEAQRLIVITGKRGRLIASAVVLLPPR